ncbi:hypothetical protein Moror_8822 [Moniliophthora roreri MCA 2997]|uniref:Uncharacterized protein n=2 Tax=Moniliophthora roreri TaxID=221103 RepID=V2YN29_MONRO|nr:hypothetical protein Moror_8822 [Moniliophthora roreri MCA 2997]
MSAALYNTLPTLADADEKFLQREAIFSQLAPLFAQYNNLFGLCLVHAHCELKDDEIMISTGDVSEPTQGVTGHPERWLASGVPYEFSSTPTAIPPPDLVAAFHAVVGTYADILGLFYAGNLTPGQIMLEHTEGRKNITEIVDNAGGNIQTAWMPGTKNPLMMACVIVCDSLTTRSGGYHKNTKSHLKQYVTLQISPLVLHFLI